MKPSLTKALLFTLVVLQCTHLAYSQQQGQQGQQQQQQDQSSGNVISGQQQSQQQEQQQQSSDVPAATSVPAATTTTPAPAVTTTTESPQPTSTQAPDTKTDATVAPPTSAAATTTTAAPTTSDAAVVPSSSSQTGNASSQSRRPVQPTTSMISSNGSLVPTVITPTDSVTQPTESGAANKKDDDSGSNKTAVIAGSVVGGLVGIALIAGLLTWMNRRGGCTSRTRRRDVQEDFTNENDYKMTENTAAAGGLGAIAAGAGAMHSSDNLPPSSPFQHARRFVPPTSNPTGYMNLQDEEYGYHQNANVGNGGAGYQPQQYQDYNAGGVYHDGSHPDYNQDYQQHDYYNNHDPYAYSADGSVTGGSNSGYQQQQQQAYYGHVPGSNVTSPTLTNSNAAGAAAAPLHQMKPDQVEQKPNVA